MNRKVRKLTSIIVIVLMVLPSTWCVYADDVLSEDPEPAPAVETTEPVAPVAEEAPAAPVSEPAAPVAEPAAPETPAAAPAAPEAPAAEPAATEAPAAEPAESEEPAAEPEAPAAEPTASAAQEDFAAAEAPAEPAKEPAAEPAAEPAGENPASTMAVTDEGSIMAGKKKTITISGTELDGSADGSGDGWFYNKDSGRIVLRDYKEGADITSDGTDVEIVATGLNKIGTLSCDGNVNVIGTGILLIDKVELKKDCTFNLLPLQEYYGENGGSVAVFLRQEDGSYMLINGSVKGIIDEKLELPEGVDLVLPANSLLELQALSVIIEKDGEGNETIIRDYSDYSEEKLKTAKFRYYVGHLLTNNLTVDKGATVVNQSLGVDTMASLVVGLNLTNNGTINGGSVTVVEDYSGSGTIDHSYLTLRKGQETSINIKDSIVSLETGDYTLDTLNLEGENNLFYEGDLEIRNIVSTSNGSVQIDSKNTLRHNNHIFKLTGSVDGSSVSIRSGITELAESLETPNNGSVDNSGYGGPVFNYSNISKILDGTSDSVFFGPDDITMPQPNSIPVVEFTLHETIDFRLNVFQEENSIKDEEYTVRDSYNATLSESGGLSFEELFNTYVPKENRDMVNFVTFEVFHCKDGKLSMSVLSTEGKFCDADGVFLIRMAYHDVVQNHIGGSVVTSTRADQTGSGRIGGNSNTILTGTGKTVITDPEEKDDPEEKKDQKEKQKQDPAKPDPAKPDPAKPDPAKPDPSKPDPSKPDPAKPAKKQSTAAPAAASSELVLRVDEYELNEDRAEDTEKVSYYTLTASMNGVQLTELSGPVSVEMDYDLPEEFREKPLYAVFANEDETSEETLKAVRAEYDEETGILTFGTSQVGDFVIVAFEFDGEEFSPEFYDELEKNEIVGMFKEHLNEAGL